MELLNSVSMGKDLFLGLPSESDHPVMNGTTFGSFLMMNGWFAELNAETSLGLSDWIRNSPEMAVMCAMILPWSARFPLSKKVGIWLYTVKLLLATSKVHGDLKNWSGLGENKLISAGSCHQTSPPCR